MVSPSARKAAARTLKEERKHSERRACRAALISRGAFRYAQRLKPGENEVRQAIRRIAREHPRYGYLRAWATLRREGMKVNHKRVHRVWKTEGLSLKRKRPGRRRHERSEITRKAEWPNHVWSYDFMEDRTERGRRIKILNIVDEYTRVCLASRVEPSMGARGVIETLERLSRTCGMPGHIRSDNGPEFAAKAVKRWIEERGAGTIYIEPGSPWENAYIESFNGKMRDECLNMEIFRNGQEARHVIESWRKEYNERRPHSALGWQTPSEFATRAASVGRATPSLHLQPPEQPDTLSSQVV